MEACRAAAATGRAALRGLCICGCRSLSAGWTTAVCGGGPVTVDQRLAVCFIAALPSRRAASGSPSSLWTFEKTGTATPCSGSRSSRVVYLLAREVTPTARKLAEKSRVLHTIVPYTVSFSPLDEEGICDERKRTELQGTSAASREACGRTDGPWRGCTALPFFYSRVPERRPACPTSRAAGPSAAGAPKRRLGLPEVRSRDPPAPRYRRRNPEGRGREGLRIRRQHQMTGKRSILPLVFTAAALLVIGCQESDSLATPGSSSNIPDPPTPFASCSSGLTVRPGQACRIGTDRIFHVQHDGTGCYWSKGSIGVGPITGTGTYQHCSNSRVEQDGFRASRIDGSNNWRVDDP